MAAQIVDAFSLGSLIGVVIVVEEKNIISTVFSGISKCHFYIVLSNCFKPWIWSISAFGSAFKVAVRISTFRINCFVNYIPAIDNSGIFVLNMSHELFDIAFHSGKHSLFIYISSVICVSLAEEPLRSLCVPYESVATHLHAVFLTPFKGWVNGVKRKSRLIVAILEIFLRAELIQNIAALHKI